jgi:rRNA maturation protein Nop10
MLRIPYCLDNRLTDGGKVVSLTHPPHFTPQKHYYYRWVDNIRMDLREVGWGDVDWIGLAKDRNRCRALVNSVLNLRVPLHAGKLSSGLT